MSITIRNYETNNQECYIGIYKEDFRLCPECSKKFLALDKKYEEYKDIHKAVTYGD